MTSCVAHKIIRDLESRRYVEPQISHFANCTVTVHNLYQFLTACEKLVPIRHVFHTNISHFVKNAHVVKLYVAYVRILHIDKIPPPPAPKSAAFCIRFQFFTCMALFYNWRGSNRLQINFISHLGELRTSRPKTISAHANSAHIKLGPRHQGPSL